MTLQWWITLQYYPDTQVVSAFGNWPQCMTRSGHRDHAIPRKALGSGGSDRFSCSMAPATLIAILFQDNWLVVEPTPLKNDGVKVSWDDCSIPNIWRVIIHSCSSHHQPDKDPFVGPEIPIPWHLHLGHQRQPSHLCGGPRGRGARARAAQGRPGGLGIHEVRWNEMKLSKPAANPQRSKRQKTYNQVYLYYIII